MQPLTWQETKKRLKSDLLRQRTSTNTKDICYALLFNTSFKICFWWRISQYFNNWKILNTITKIIYRHYQFKTGVQISPYADIDGGLAIAHFSCIVISDCKIGKHFTIMQGSTIGSYRGSIKGGSPSIGDNVVICAGAKVIGNIKLGNNAMVGANAVVVKDIPDNAVVAGVPARIINMNGIERTSYH